VFQGAEDKTMSLDFPNRHPIQRARFFLQRAEGCGIGECDEFEAYLEAAIVFGRSAIPWTQRKLEDSNPPGWKEWWESLKDDPSIKFFKYYRDDIVHERPPKVHQIIRMGGSDAGARATELYYFETREIPATDTVRRHLTATTEHVVYAHEHFSDKAG
jgi:hypothetical protein